jgi:flagellar biosynthesis protein FlhF
MKVKKFEGATMRDAIAKVKAELGDQAVIISTREIRRGLLGTAVEISAAIDDAPEAPAPMAPPAPRQQGEDLEKALAPLRTEMRSLRALVRTADNGKATTELRSELFALRRLVEDLRANPLPTTTGQTTPPPMADIPLVRPSSGRILMLVGPTGAGKTTTIAKLAANAALIENRRVRLVTLDNYRVGGIDQIRTFADLIGVPLVIAPSPAQLPEILADDSYDLTLIDTAGRSPRDTAAIEELAGALSQAPKIEVHLVIPAAASAQAIDELAARYRILAPARLLFTKLDEVERAPELATAPGRTRLSITWITTGQAVPEDIEQPTSARVLELSSRGLSSAFEPASRSLASPAPAASPRSLASAGSGNRKAS